MYRVAAPLAGGHDRLENSLEPPSCALAIGTLRALAGSVAITRANTVISAPACGDAVYEGDRIETGIDGFICIEFADGTALALHSDASMLLDEFIFARERATDRGLIRILKGMFGLVAGKVAAGERLIIDTPYAQIRGRTSSAAIGSVAFGILTLALVDDLRAASTDLTFLDNGVIDYKDLKHGVYVIHLKKPILNPDGTETYDIVVDDPGVSLEFKIHGSSVGLTQVVNSPSQMGLFQNAYASAHAVFSQYQQDAFFQRWQNADAQPQSTTNGGSSTDLALLITPGHFISIGQTGGTNNVSGNAAGSNSGGSTSSGSGGSNQTGYTSPVYWRGGSGDWGLQATNQVNQAWYPDFLVPRPGDTAIIDASSETAVIAINDGPVQIAILELNTGTLEIAGGNSLTASDLLAMAGGTTISGAGGTASTLINELVFDVEDGPPATLNGVYVDNTGAIITVGLTSTSTLLLDGGTTILGGDLTIGSSGALDVEIAGCTSKHPDATLDGVIVTNSNFIEVGATSAAVLLLDDGTTITGGNLTVATGTLDIEKGPGAGPNYGATLSGMAVTNDGTIEVGATSVVTLLVDDGTTITNEADGKLKIYSDGAFDVQITSIGNADTADGIEVDGTLKVDTGSGTLQLTGAGELRLVNGTITGAVGTESLDNVGNAITGYGQIEQLALLQNEATINANSGGNTLVINTGASAIINDGGTLEATSGGILQIDSDVTNASGTLNANASGSEIDIQPGLTISDGQATVESDGQVTITAGVGVTFDNVMVTDDTTSTTTPGIDIPSGATLTLDAGTAISSGVTGATMTLAGTLAVNNGSNTISNVTVTDVGTSGSPAQLVVSGGTLTLSDDFFSGGVIEITVDSGSSLVLSNDTQINNAILVTEPGSTLTVSSNSSIETINSTLSGTNTVEPGATLTLTDENVTGTIENKGIVDVETAGVSAYGAIFDGVIVTNTGPSPNGGIEVGETSAATLTLIDGTSISGGTLSITGTGKLDVEQGSNAIGPYGATIDDVEATNKGTIEVGATSTATLTLTDDSVNNFLTAGAPPTTAYGTITVASGGTLDLTDTGSNTDTIDDGQLNNNGGTVNVGLGGGTNGNVLIEYETGTHNLTAGTDSFTNSGTVEVFAGSTLTLTDDSVDNSGGSITVGGTDAGILDLTGGTQINGSGTGTMTVESAGAVDVTGAATLSGIIVTDDNTTDGIDVTGTLTLTGGTAITSAVDGTMTVESAGAVDVTGAATLSGIIVTDDNTTDGIDVTGTLTLTGGTAITSAVDGTMTVESAGAVDVTGDATLSGITVTDDSTTDGIDVTGTLTLTGGTQIIGNGTGTLTIGTAGLLDVEHGPATITGPDATLDGVAVTDDNTIEGVGVGLTTTATLLLDDGTTITGNGAGTMTIGADGTLDVEQGPTPLIFPDATLTGMLVTDNGNLDVGLTSAATLLIDGGSVDGTGAINVGAAVSYTTIDDPNVPTGGSEAVAINDAGSVLGTYSNAGINQGFVDLPGSGSAPVEISDGTLGTSVKGFNDLGDVVGSYLTTGGASQAFVFDGTTYSDVDDTLSGANGTVAYGINDNGLIVADEQSANGEEGFIYDLASATTVATGIDDTNANSLGSKVIAINNDGDVIGNYTDAAGTASAFVYVLGTYYYYEIDPLHGVNAGTTLAAIDNSGDVAGTFTDTSGNSHGFVESSGGFVTEIDDPAAVNGTTVTSFNDDGEAVGYYTDAAGVEHAFVYEQGVFFQLDVPGATSSEAVSINEVGDIVGTYTDAGGNSHVFATSIPLPSVLELDDGASIGNATMSIGDFDAVEIESTGASFDGVTVTNSGAVLVDPGATLILDAGAAIKGGTLMLAPLAEVDIEGTGATLSSVGVSLTSESFLVAEDATLELVNTVIWGGTLVTTDAGGMPDTSGATGEIEISGANGSNVTTFNGSGFDPFGDPLPVTIDAYVLIDQQGQLELVGAIVNDGVIDVDGALGMALVIDGAVNLTGGGNITLGGSLDAIIDVPTGATWSTDNVISGAGTIGTGDGLFTILNHGTIDATGVLLIDTGGNPTHVLTNYNVVEATNGGDLQIETTKVVNNTSLGGGTITVDDTSSLTLEQNGWIAGGTVSNFNLVEVSGDAELSGGTFTNAQHSAPVPPSTPATYGTLQIDDGNTLTLSTEAISGGIIDIGTVPNTGTTGTPTAGASIDIAAASTINDGATLNDGSISLDHRLTLDGTSGAITVNNTAFTTEAGHTLAILGDVTMNGSAITDNGTVSVGTASIAATLTLDDGAAMGVSSVSAGNNTLTISALSQVDIEAGSGSGASFDGITVTTTAGGSLEIGESSAVTATLQIDGGTKISGGALAIGFAGGDDQLDVESATGATLSGVAVITYVTTDGIEVGQTSNSTLTVTGATTLENGTLTLGSADGVTGTGILDVESSSSANLDDVIINAYSLNDAIDIAQTTTASLILSNGTVMTGGSLFVGTATSTGTLNIEDGGATLSNVAVTDYGTINVDLATPATLTIEDGTIITGETGNKLVVGTTGTLDAEAGGGTGATLDGVDVTDNNMIEVGNSSTTAAAVLLLDGGTQITGNPIGALQIGNATSATDGTGEVDIEGGAPVILDNVNVTALPGNAEGIEVGATTAEGTLLLKGGTTMSGGTLAAGSATGTGLVDVETSGGAILYDVTVTNFTSTGAGSGAIEVGASVTGSVLTLEGNTGVDGGSLTVFTGSSVDVEGPTAPFTGTTTVTFDGVGVTDNGTINVDPAAAATLTLDDGTDISGGGTGKLVIATTGTLDIEAGALGDGATLDGMVVTNKNTGTTTQGITVGAGSAAATLLLDDGTLITGGTMTLGSATPTSTTGILDVEAGNSGPNYGATLDGVTATLDGSSEIEVGATSTATLTLDGGTTITGGTATIGATGTVMLAGATLGTNTVTNNGALSGYGTVSANVSGAGTITASGGTLEVTGAITNAGSLALTVGTGADLLLDGADAATSATFSGSTGTLEFNTAGTLTLTDALSIGTDTLKLDGSGSTLTDANGVTLSTGTITGQGTVAAAVTTSGAAHITANGGTLEITGVITDSGTALTLSDTSSTGTLKLDATGDQAQTLTLNGGTLLLNGATLTVGTQAVLGAGKVTLAGSGATFTDGSGATISSGTISGDGVFASTLAASGAAHVTASDGTLEMQSAITNTGSLALTVTGASDRLKLDAGSAATSLSFNGSSGTLELNTGGTLTLANALTVGAGTVQLDGSGSTLTDTKGVTLTTGTITGVGKVAAAVSDTGAGFITATGGTLEVTGAVTNSGSLELTVGSGASDRLLLDAASAATSLTFLGSTGTLELNTAGMLTLANALAIGANTVQLDGSGSTLTDAAGITLTTGTITGQGTVAAAVSDSSGAGTITASGGTLDLSGIVTVGDTFMIATGSASTLEFTNTAEAAAAIAISNSNQTLEIGAGGDLTIDVAESITNGTILMAGGTLNDASSLTIGSGATLSGFGTVTANIGTGGGTITASGGTLDLSGIVTVGDAFTIATVAGSTLEFTNTAEAASAITISNANQTLEVGTGGNLTIDAAESITHGTIELSGGTLNDGSGLTVGTAATLSGDGTVTANLIGTGSGNIEASDGTLDLTGDLTAASTLDFTSGGTLQIDGGGSNTATTFAVSTGAILEITTSLTVSGNVTGSGIIEIDNGGLLDLTSTSATELGPTIDFTAGSGAVDIAEKATNYSVNVEGWTDTTQILDFTGITYVTSGAGTTTLSGPSGDVYTLTSGTGASEHTVTITVSPTFSGTLQLADFDGHPEVFDPPLADDSGTTVSDSTSLTVASGGSLTVDAASNATVTFTAGTGSLVLDDPSGFSGQIVGFTGTAPTAAQSDVVDVAGVNYNSGSFIESYNSTTGVLTVNDGTNSASLTFVGFTGTFEFASDGNGGTDVFDPPATNTSSPPVSLGNDRFVFHPSLGGDAGSANTGDDSAAHDPSAWAHSEEWSALIADTQVTAAVDVAQPADSHWHHALHNATHLH